MAYVNEEEHVLQYTLIGYCTVNMHALKAWGNNIIKITSRPEYLFYKNADGMYLVHNIYPMDSAFSINVEDSNHNTVSSFIALVTKVITFEYMGELVHLEFMYKEVSPHAISTDLFEVKPSIEHIIVHAISNGHIIGLMIYGDTVFVEKYIYNNMKVFHHGGTIYYLQKFGVVRAKFQYDDEEKQHKILPVATCVVATSIKLPKKEEVEDFFIAYPKFVFGGK